VTCMRKLNLTKDFMKFCDVLPPKRFKQVVAKTLALASNPRPHDSIELKGSSGQFRVDIGEYRVIYEFDKEEMRVCVIDKRNDGQVYRSG